VPQVRITDPDQYQSIVDAEWKVIYGKLDKIVATGANIVLSRLAIGDLATQSVCAPASGRPNGPSVCCSGVAYGGCAVPALGAYSCATAVYLFFSFFSGTSPTVRSSALGASKSPTSCACARPPAGRCRPRSTT
jgi:hypothetical protein